MFVNTAGRVGIFRDQLNSWMKKEVDVSVLAERITALAHRMSDGFTMRDKALEVALDALTEQLHTMNEFRGAMSDAASRYINRAEHEAVMTQLNNQALAQRSIAAEYVPRQDMMIMTSRIENLEKQQSALHARYAMVALLFSTGVVVANLILVFFHNT